MNATPHIVPFETVDQESIGLLLKYEQGQIHGEQTLKCLDALRRERQLCDVILTVEGHELFAHRALLSCHSNYFLELFLTDDSASSGKNQIYYQLDGLEYLVLKLILEFIYQGSFSLSSELVPKVYLVANQLRIESIFKACSNYLAEQLNEQNCLSTRLLAIDDDLREKASECIQKNFFNVVQTREFSSLPSIKLEIIDSSALPASQMCDLILNWIVQQLRKDNSSLNELNDYMHLLYLNGDKTLHDCVEMDDQNVHFSYIIKDYQNYKLTKRSLSTSSGSNNGNEICLFETINLQVVDSKIPINVHPLETKLIHLAQSAEYSYIAIAIVMGRMISLAIHVPPITSGMPLTPEKGDNPFQEKTNDDSQQNTEKDVQFASLSKARCGFGLTSSNNAMYAVGGYDRGYCLDTIEQYDPVENKWILLSPVMGTRRGRVSATIVNNKIYVCGGSDGQKELNTGECLDLNCMDKWIPIKELNTPVAHGAMCNDDVFIYLIGGCEGDSCKNDAYQYDPQNNIWTTLPPMHCERSQAAAVYFNGKLYVFGGYTGNRCLSSCEIFNVTTNEWMIGPSMRENRRGCAATLYKNKIFVIGGSNGVNSLSSVEIFDPVANEWILDPTTIQNDLNVPRVGVGITVCGEKLYVIGGFDGRNFLKTIEVYDELTHRWRLTNGKAEKNY